MSDPSPQAPPQLKSIHDRLSNFPDRFGPMLVKELRQGLRGHGFTLLFLILQIILFLFFLGVFTNPDSQGEGLSTLLFFFFGIALCVVQPLRCMGAISNEVKNDTLDLIRLTGMSSWRIVIGKWSSVVSQSALVLATALPYLITRYFLGGMELFAELTLLTLLFFISAAITAGFVATSASTLIILRLLPILLSIGIMLFLSVMCLEEFDELISFASPSDSSSWSILLGVFAFVAFICYLALEIATTRISASSENRAFIKRPIMLLLAVTLALPFSIFQTDYAEAGVFCGLFLWICTVDLISERINAAPSVPNKFSKLGIFGVFGKIFFLPVWRSGLLFLFLLITFFLVTSEIAFRKDSYRYTTDDNSLLIFSSHILSLTFVTRLISRTEKGDSFGLFVILSTSSLFIPFIFEIFEHLRFIEVAYVVFPFGLFNCYEDYDGLLYSSFILFLLLNLLLIGHNYQKERKTQKVVQQVTTSSN